MNPIPSTKYSSHYISLIFLKYRYRAYFKRSLIPCYHDKDIQILETFQPQLENHKDEKLTLE